MFPVPSLPESVERHVFPNSSQLHHMPGFPLHLLSSPAFSNLNQLLPAPMQFAAATTTGLHTLPHGFQGHLLAADRQQYMRAATLASGSAYAGSAYATNCNTPAAGQYIHKHLNSLVADQTFDT